MKIKSFLLTLAMLAVALGASAATLNGKHYEGIGKVAGQAIDFWVTADFNTDDANIKIANAINVSGAYTESKTASALNITVNAAGGKKTTLKSTDGGSSLEGSLVLNGNNVKLWLLEVPANHTACNLPEAELTKIITAPEGYTSFIRINMQGAEMSATCDFTFNADGTYTLICDNTAIKQIFSNAKGTFKVSGSEVTITDATGKTTTGTISDNGTYIVFPFGSAQGMKLSMVLIR